MLFTNAEQKKEIIIYILSIKSYHFCMINQ